jgi:hypothetical protein
MVLPEGPALASLPNCSAAAARNSATEAGVGFLREAISPGALRGPGPTASLPLSGRGFDGILAPYMPKQPNGTPGKKPPAPSVEARLGRTPLEQRSGSKPLAPSAQRPSTADESEAGQRSKPIPERRGRR